MGTWWVGICSMSYRAQTVTQHRKPTGPRGERLLWGSSVGGRQGGTSGDLRRCWPRGAGSGKACEAGTPLWGWQAEAHQGVPRGTWRAGHTAGCWLSKWPVQCGRKDPECPSSPRSAPTPHSRGTGDKPGLLASSSTRAREKGAPRFCGRKNMSLAGSGDAGTSAWASSEPSASGCEDSPTSAQLRGQPYECLSLEPTSGPRS